MKAKTIIGRIISVLIITYMLVVLIKTNFVAEEYSSGMIKGQSNKLSGSNSEIGLEKDKVAPDFELQSLSGEIFRLSDYRGEKIFLNFWASWCGPCKEEMPYMENYYKKHKDLGNIEIIAVNMTKSEINVEKVQGFVDSYGLTFPVLLDSEGEVEKLYRVLGYPTTYLINEEGIIVNGFSGSLNNDEEIKELIDSIK